MNLSEKALKVKESSTLNITAKAKAMMAQGIDIVGFGAGEPDFNTPVNVCNAAIKAINDGFTKYTPSSGTVELRKAICDKLKRDNGLTYDISQIVVSNGAKHSLSNIFAAILNEGDEVIIPAPYWLSYAEMVRIDGGVAKIVYTKEENNYAVTKELLEEAYSPKTKAIIINSPNNPTGMIYSLEALKVVAQFAKEKDLFVISDEIYECLIYDTNSVHISMATFDEDMYDRTIVVNGLSKSFSMTGWRIGYTASNKKLAEVMGNIQSHAASNPNSIAQKAALAALTGDQSFVFDMNKEFARRRDYIYDRVCNMPLISALKPQGAFYIFIDVSKVCEKSYKGEAIKDAAQIADILISQFSVAAVPCADFGFPKHIRLSYAISMENIEKGMDRIESFVKSL